MKKKFIYVIFLLVSAMTAKAQVTQQAYNQATIEFNITDIAQFDERIFFIYDLVNDSRFDVKTSEEDGIFLINASDAYESLDLAESFADFRRQNASEFAKMDKEQASETACEYKSRLSDDLVLSLMMDVYIRSRQNSTCATADPFCTDNGLYQFPAGVGAGSGEAGPSYDCLRSTPNPAWYYMQIANPGNMDIYMYSTPSRDIDFCCWGPFDDPITPCPYGLTANKVVSCSYSASPTEHCLIPTSAQTGDYFILVITNFSNQACNISFEKQSGTGTTNCGILPPLVSNGGPYCTGETIRLSANGQAGSTYRWTGPGNWTSNLQNPTRTNATVAMSGTYTCTITIGTQTNSASTEVVVNQKPTANFTYTSVCKGSPTQFNANTSGNPNNTTYNWVFGDGQTGSGASVTHTYANAGNYTVQLTAQKPGTNCRETKTYTVPVYATPAPTASAQPNTIIYGGTAQLSAQAGATGSFNFHWEPANKVASPNSQNTSTLALNQTTTFTVTVTNPQGNCTATAQVTVSIEGSNMTATATADEAEICEGNSTTLHVNPSGGTGNFTYAWTPANTLNNSNIQHPIATPPVGTTTYTCHVSDGMSSQDVSVTITVHPNEVQEIERTICENDSTEFYGEYFQAPGTYEHMDQTEFGCEKLVRLVLTNYDTYETPITRHICQGESYNFFGQQLSSSGIYYHTLQSAQGCDSVIKLNLVHDPRYEYDIYESTCEGGIGFWFDGAYRTEEGQYTYTGQTVKGCDSIVTLNLTLTEYNTKTYNVELCQDHFTWASNGETYTQSGTYYDTLSYSNTCDSTLTLNLLLKSGDFLDEYAVACDSYRWQNEYYGVDMTFNTEGHHDKTIQYINYVGCPSEVTLHLDINNHDETTFTVQQDLTCDSYFWDPQGKPFEGDQTLDFTHTGNYTRTYKNIHDCDSIVTMQLTMEYTPSPYEIRPQDWNAPAPHWVVPATEFQVNTYQFTVYDSNPNCHWDTIYWTCQSTAADSLKWILDWNQNSYNSSNCDLYVLEYVPDTIHLTAHIQNRCELIERDYWLVCSFYGIEDQNLAPANFSVVPNPNNGKMTLNFESLTGKITVKVYDMNGILIDNFKTNNETGPSSMSYDMKRHAPGIYFFVANGREGTVAKKVVVTR